MDVLALEPHRSVLFHKCFIPNFVAPSHTWEADVTEGAFFSPWGCINTLGGPLIA